jgi:hypothetical protein
VEPGDYLAAFGISQLGARLYDLRPTPADGDRVVLAPCDGAIDSINDMRPPPAVFPADGMLVATGWLARSVSNGDVGEHVYLVLADSTGHRTLFCAIGNDCVCTAKSSSIQFGGKSRAYI